MENINSGSQGTTMSAGVASPVRSNAPTIPETSTIRSEPINRSEISAARSQDIDRPVSIPERPEQDSGSFASAIEEKAKKDGVDKAFEELAKDEEDTQETHRIVDGGNNNNVEEQETLEKQDPIGAEVEELKMRVQELSEQNAELKARVNKVEQVSQLAALSAYELALILKKLIEEAEQDKQKKESLLAMLATLIATLLTMILVDDKNQDRSNSGDSTVIEKLAA